MFSLCDLDMQMEPFEQFLKIIRAKIGQNPVSSLGEMSFEAIVDDTQHTTDNTHPTHIQQSQ